MAIDIYAPSPLDGLSPEEQKLYNLVNEYRAENGLAPIPASKALTTVANRHVLDLEENIDRVTHAWSDAVYDSNNPDTFSSMWNAPQRFNTGYPGNGYENAHGGSGGYIATAESALNSWKNSPLHNDVILNQGTWTDNSWNALGVGIYGGYAVLWFGEEVDPTGNPEITQAPPEETTSVYRFYDTITGTHFYTANEAEKDSVIQNLPKYNYEGPSFAALQNDTTDTEEVHRFYNRQTGTHFYTISDFEADRVRETSPQFNYEGTAYYAYDESVAGTIPLYRFYRPDTGTHFYTPSDGERDHVINTLGEVYNYEGIAYYVMDVNM